ncbi:Uncharacterised protein [uncultured archaeon]|nr:Uncharacterised protein [uncultured archaeon]
MISWLANIIFTVLLGIAALVVVAVVYLAAEYVEGQYPYQAWAPWAACVGIPLLIIFVLPYVVSIPLVSMCAMIFAIGAVIYLIFGDSLQSVIR